MKRIILALMVLCLSAVLFSACDEGQDNQRDQAQAVEKDAKKQKAYLPHNHVELNNYNKAQQLYDSPSTIIWCSTTWGNPSSPIVTFPITGKLTSSSTTYFPPDERADYSGDGVGAISTGGTARSVDGLFHPNPPPYRYGFTPGGQYVDFFNMPTVCTTAMSKFQRQETAISTEVDPEAAALTRKAEDALKKGDKGAAQKYLEQIGSTQAGG